MKRKVLAVMLAGTMALQSGVWVAAEEGILVVEDLGGVPLR